MLKTLKIAFLYSLLLLPFVVKAGLPIVTSKTLPNGLRVIVCERAGTQLAVIKLCYNAGIKNETDNLGLSRVMALMMSGKTTRPKDVTFTEKIKRLAGFTTTEVDEDKTVFTTTTASKNIEKVLEAEAARMVDAAITDDWISYCFTQADLQQAIEADDWYTNFFITRNQLMYNEAHPYYYKKIGKRPNTTECFNFYRNYYHPANATLVIVTSNKASLVLPLVEKQLGIVAKRGVLGSIQQPEPLKWPVEILRNITPASTSAVLSFVVKQPLPTDTDYYAYGILNHILLNPQHGLLSIHFGITGTKVNTKKTLFPTYYTLDLIVAEDKNRIQRSIDESFGKFLYKGFDSTRIVAAKQQVFEQPLLLQKANNEELAKTVLDGEYYANDAEHFFKSDNGYQKVSAEQVRMCLRNYFLGSNVRTFIY